MSVYILVDGEVEEISDKEWAEMGYSQPSQPLLPPDNPTLGDWRVALLLWGRLDDLLDRVAKRKASGDPIGAVADERVNYSNNVLRSQLMSLKGVFSFSEEEVDESLWRAERVRIGDLSGVWPLTNENANGNL